MIRQRFQLAAAGAAIVCLISPFADQAPSAQSAVNKASITVGPNVHISKPLESRAHFELLGGADPTNPDRLLSCSIVSDRAKGRDTTVAYASWDGGKSWTKTLDTDAYYRTGDPVCTFAPGGTALYSALALARPGSTERNKTLVYRSTDGGKSWSKPLEVPIIDRQYVVGDATDGKYKGRLYLHGTGTVQPLGSERRKTSIALFTSTDDGVSFTGPVIRASLGRGWVLGTAGGVVLSDGTLVLLVGEIKEYEQPDGTSNVPEPGANKANSTLKLLTSKDGGDSFQNASTVSDWHFAWPPSSVCCVPWLAVDPGSQAFKDRLYAVWSDLRSRRSEIMLAFSSDKGKTWSTPEVVSDDGPAPRGREGPDHFKPVVEVSRDGVVGVMWHDRRDAPDNLGWKIRFAASLDGGETFLPSVVVSDSANAFGKQDEWVIGAFASGGGTPRPAGSSEGEGPPPGSRPLSVNVSISGFTFNGGHTVAMPVDGHGVFHPMWVDNRTGLPQAWTAAVSVRGPVTRHGSTELAALEDLSSKLAIEFTGSVFDRASNTVSITARLRNTSKDVVRGPLKARVVTITSAVGRPQIVNADNGESASGAVWDFSSVLQNNTLKPDELSGGKTLRVRLTDLRPFNEGREFKFGLVQLDLRVFGSSSSQTDGPAQPVKASAQTFR